MHAVSPLHPQSPYCDGWKTVQAFTEKHPRISGPMQFKLMLFKGLLYMQ